MKELKITTTVSEIVVLDGLDLNDAIKKAADISHEVLSIHCKKGKRNEKTDY